MSITYTDEQDAAISSILDWWSKGGEQVFKLHGYAGTGKTTVIQEVVRQIRRATPGVDIHYAAPTGKAASVMRAKGLTGATTLHSDGLIFAPRKSKAGNPYFHPLTGGEAMLDEIDLLVVDEVSMVGDEMLSRIQFHPDGRDLFNWKSTKGGRRDLRVLAVGDPAQLWPIPDRVKGEPSPDFKPSPWAIEGEHDARLETIHRTDSGHILEAATAVRGPGDRDYGIAWDRLGTGTEVSLDQLMSVDQIIVASHAVRHAVNRKVRKALGYPEDVPVRGDRLVLLKNSDVGVNGEQFTVDWAIAERTEKTEKLPAIRYYRIGLSNGSEVDVPASLFGSSSREEDKAGKSLAARAGMLPLQFAYAVTCHSAQGSEWGRVLVVDEGCAYSMPGWHYTAFTRGRDWVGFMSARHLPDEHSMEEVEALLAAWTSLTAGDRGIEGTATQRVCEAILEVLTESHAVYIGSGLWGEIAARADRSLSTVRNHATKLREMGYLAGSGTLTRLAIPEVDLAS